MELIKTITAEDKIQQLLKKPSNSSEPAPALDCDKCSDTGRVFVKFEANGKEYNGVKDCACRLENLRKKRLALIPPKFQGVSLRTLTAKTPIQKQAIVKVKTNPSGSFIFCGKFGTGKTHLLWTLYKHAVMQDAQRIVACKLVTLMDEFKRAIAESMAHKDTPFYPRIAAEDLRQTHTRYSIFFDDIDKDTPTEYVAKQVFDLADAIYENNHQIVTTTNLRLAELKDYFDKADPRFGGGIVRRLVDNAEIIEMF